MRSSANRASQDTKELFEPLTKTVTDTSQKSHEKTKSTTEAVEELDEASVHAKALELRK